MEDRKKSPSEVAAYNAGMELLRSLQAEPKQDEAPTAAYVLPISGFDKSNLN
jgi:hypothetical protein